MMNISKRSSNSYTRKPLTLKKHIPSNRKPMDKNITNSTKKQRINSRNKRSPEGKPTTNAYNNIEIKTNESEFIKLPVIKMCESDNGRNYEGRQRYNNLKNSNKFDISNNYVTEAYQSQSSIYTTHTGILDTIDEEKDERRKKILLSIFNTNFDHGKKINLSGLKITKNLDKKVKNMLNSAMKRKNIIQPVKSLKLSKKLKSELSAKPALDSQISFSYSNLSMTGNGAHSVTRKSNSDYFQLPKMKSSIRYDPKQDRFSKLHLERKRSLNQPEEDKKDLVSPLKMLNSKRKRNYLNGQLSYSNIAMQLHTKSSLSDFIKL
mmetsp:Transcript_11788/g.10426  ORF Transcript_11788/g.10426 Transcript_11788/m.10426 type:complete len:320 (+) Transcript_11788:21-980(+)